MSRSIRSWPVDSNRRQVTLEHGLYTGQTLFGFNVEATLAGLQVRAEWEQNLLYRQFPVQGVAVPDEFRPQWNTLGNRVYDTNEQYRQQNAVDNNSWPQDI